MEAGKQLPLDVCGAKHICALELEVQTVFMELCRSALQRGLTRALPPADD